MDLFKILDTHKKRRRAFYKNDEFMFYLENRSLITKMPKFSYLNKNKMDEFDIMRINIIFHSYLNKQMIENEVSNLSQYAKKLSNEVLLTALREKMVDQAYLMDKKTKIYIPFFTKAANLIYLNEPLKLTKYPYSSLKEEFNDSMIDLFDIYGYELYNSYFTRLIKVTENDGIGAFFHYDTNTIYMINDQGRLDGKIVLFDRYIRKPNYNHMLERIKPVCDAYFSYDRDAFIKSLRDNDFMSPHLFYLIKLLDWRRNK